MALNLPLVTVEGNLTADPDLRFTPQGTAVANLNIAVNTRKKDGDNWVDGEPTFLRAAVWKELAENVAESLAKGDRVLVHGEMFQKNFTDKDGNNRSSYEIRVEAIGPSLKWATTKVNKVSKNGGGGGSRQTASVGSGWDDSGDGGW